MVQSGQRWPSIVKWMLVSVAVGCLLVAASIFASISSNDSTARAEDVELSKIPCSERFRPGLLLDLNTKIPRDYPVERILGSHRYRIPWAYILGRPQASRVNCVPELKRMSLAFWVPDFQPPIIDLSPYPDTRPKEVGRPNPGPDESVVRINSITPIRETETIEILIADSRRYIWDDKPQTPDGAFIRVGDIDWYREGGRGSVVIRCLTELCSATFDYKDLNLQVTAFYLRTSIQQHDMIADWLHNKLSRWRVQ